MYTAPSAMIDPITIAGKSDFARSCVFCDGTIKHTPHIKNAAITTPTTYGWHVLQILIIFSENLSILF